jgi:hypothetical protein
MDRATSVNRHFRRIKCWCDIWVSVVWGLVGRATVIQEPQNPSRLSMWRKESRGALRLYLGMRRQRSGLSDTLQGREIDDKDAVPWFDEVGVQRSPALRSLQTI